VSVAPNADVYIYNHDGTISSNCSITTTSGAMVNSPVMAMLTGTVILKLHCLLNMEWQISEHPMEFHLLIPM